MEISIEVSGGINRYIVFNIDDDLVFCDESISSVLGINLFEYKQRFKNVCNISNTEYGIVINDEISDEEIIKRFEQEFASELMILKINNSYWKQRGE